jgi:hypothetical protein
MNTLLYHDHFEEYFEYMNRDEEELEPLEKECVELTNELQELEKMSEDEACKFYNVDSKDEAREYIIGWYNWRA